MAYFPAFLKLDNKKILIVGGGYIAYEKLKHLLDFTQDISIIASEFCENMTKSIQKENLLFEKRNYKVGDVKGFDIVIIAVDSIELQSKIFTESRQYNCLCNAVDSVDYCDFIFPSYIKKDDLTIAISTSGASPSFAKHFKLYLQKLIPEDISLFLNEMKTLRTSLAKGKKRMEIFDKKVKEYIEKWD